MSLPKRIDELSSVASITSADVLPLVQAGITKNAPAGLVFSSNLFTQTGTGAVARSINSKFGDKVSLDDFVTNTTPGTTDCSSGLQAAINYISGLGGGTVECMNPPYKIATASGSTVTLPADSSTMPYCVELKANVKIKGPGRDRVTFVGDHTYRTTAINTSQKIMFRLTDSPSGASYYFEDVQFSNCMLPVYHSGIISGYMRNCAFTGCALPFICQQAERFEWNGIDFGTPSAGIMVGGWLVPAGSAASGGWADKCQFKRISYIRFLAGWTSTENDVDTFFDTHFFNNAGLSASVPFKGVSGIPIYVVGRRDRPTFNLHISDVFSYGNSRPAIFGGLESTWDIRNVNCEKVGYADDTATSIMGVGTVDPWSGARARALVDIYASSNVSSFRDIYATSCAAVDLISQIPCNKSGNLAGASANPDLTNPYAGATMGEYLKISFANPDIAGLWINATTGTNAAGAKYTNTAGSLFTGIDNSTGGRIGGVANAAYFWQDYNGTILFGTNNAEILRMTASLFKVASGLTMQFGTNTAKGAEAFASFITINDAAGNARKLMVCA